MGPYGTVMYSLVQSHGEGDPHFLGFHGEKFDLTHGKSDLLQLMCTVDFEVTTQLSATPDNELFMTEVYVRLGDDYFAYGTNQEATLNGKSVGTGSLPSGGSIHVDDKGVVIKFDGFTSIFAKHTEKGVLYLNVDFKADARVSLVVCWAEPYFTAWMSTRLTSINVFMGVDKYDNHCKY